MCLGTVETWLGHGWIVDLDRQMGPWIDRGDMGWIDRWAFTTHSGMDTRSVDVLSEGK